MQVLCSHSHVSSVTAMWQPDKLLTVSSGNWFNHMAYLHGTHTTLMVVTSLNFATVTFPPISPFSKGA